jgi:protein TonB
MIISEFDLYKSEWLELVFAKRNKEYGAYYLRQHYSGNMVKAMAITFITVSGIFVGTNFMLMAKPHKPVVKMTEITLSTYHKPLTPPKKEKPKQQSAPPKHLTPTIKFVTPTITTQPVAAEPPKLIEMKGDVGPETITIPEGSGGKVEVNDGSGGSGTAIKEDDSKEVFTTAGVDVEPEPYGGAAGWIKFLQKNLKYPKQALENNQTGKVWLSFIVEKNGHISSINLERGAGYGMDEEAIRVLKLSPPWKPGLQHGNPVRVKYTLLLNFVLNE